MANQTQKGVQVTVLRHHTWRGTEYNPGDTYTVDGDASQTVDQYLDTLKGTGLAARAEDAGTGPNIVSEIGEPGSTAVAPMTTESVNQPEHAEPAKASAKPATKPVAAKTAAKRTAKAAKPAGKKK